MNTLLFICETVEDMGLAIGEVEGLGGNILYQSRAGTPENGKAYAYNVAGSVPSGKTLRDYTDKYIVLAQI